MNAGPDNAPSPRCFRVPGSGFGVLAGALLMGGAPALAQTSPSPSAQAVGATVIPITHTGCQFLEPEGGVDHGFKTQNKTDCDRINEKTAKDRLGKATQLTVKPGKYIFRVTNKNVPYETGFWLRGVGPSRLMQPNVSGRGLKKGATRDYAVELTAGDYAYSCPLNPTPDYPLIVKE